MEVDKFIERKIITGLIVSTEFIQQVRGIWNSRLLESSTAKRMAQWCIEYFDNYNRAPNRDIEGIYFDQLKVGLPKEEAEDIEDIIHGLSDEYDSDKFNVQYLLDQTNEYLQGKHLEAFAEQIKDAETPDEANKIALDYKPLAKDVGNALLLSESQSLKKIDLAFDTSVQSILQYPRQLGEFWNQQMVRGGLVALMASEKRGKSYWLLDMAVRAVRQKSKVAFFQAGDMTEAQQLRRLCIHLTKKSDLERYCGKMYEPVRDCIHNQRDTCERDERECDFGIFDAIDYSEGKIRYEVTSEELIEAYEEEPDYKPCYNCKDYWSKKFGAAWVKKVEVKSPLTVKKAKEAIHKFFVRNKRQFMLSTHANGTLSIGQIKALLATWEKQDGFSPDLIVVDYADLLVSETKVEHRHQQNEIWKGLRNISQERHCLVLTVTQADANSYERNRLSLRNFSEDKRKYSHVTAMYGLNQDPGGREKDIGIMRINELVVREGDFNPGREVHVLQNLRRGQPFLGSYF